MTLTVSQGFDKLLDRLIPLASQRAAATKHRASVEASLKSAMPVNLFREVGSFGHGTGVRGFHDVDLLVSIKATRPDSSDTALRWVRDALNASFPYTPVRVSRPAVVVEFAGKDETWEVIPGLITSNNDSVKVYDIPGAASGWMRSAPLEHLAYVNSVNNADDIKGGAKKLARLVKAWKYYNDVPISSFYLEMRAAQYMTDEPSFIASQDMCRFLERLHRSGLDAMNDPKGVSGRFYACSSNAKAAEALSKVATASTRARKATDASDPATAFRYFDLLFNGHFPARV